ncbi:MAG: hypothetical protein WC780_01125 [Lentimicrobiaceae bacterium]|jgi:hypothetical protein
MREKFQFLILPLLFIWELPQNLLGFVVFVIMKTRRRIITTEKEAHHFYIETPNTGVSLGWLIFWTPSANRFSHLINDCRMHESGHAHQSVILGPIYLLVVGVPSLARVIYSRWYRKKYDREWENYFNGFPENWADKLGGVSV